MTTTELLTELLLPSPVLKIHIEHLMPHLPLWDSSEELSIYLNHREKSELDTKGYRVTMTSHAHLVTPSKRNLAASINRADRAICKSKLGKGNYTKMPDTFGIQ